MSKKYFLTIAIIIIIAIIILFCIDTQDFVLKIFRLNMEFWSSLISTIIGAIIGAVVTILGINLTLTEQKKTIKN